MVGGPWSAWLAAALVPVVGWCALELVRSLRRSRDQPVPLDVVAWHGVMGTVMLVGLWWTVSAGWDRAGAVLFASTGAWCAFRATTRGSMGHYTRLGLMSAAMAVLLMPSGAATAATPGPSGGPMPGMAQTGHTGSGMLLPEGAALVVAVVLVILAIAAGRVIAGAGARRVRVSAGCEVAMAGVMTVMAVGLI